MKLIANGDPGTTGRVVPQNAEEEGNPVLDQWPHPHQMEVNLVKAMVRNGKTAILKPAMSIVNGDLGVSGRLAPRHADGE